MKKVLGICVNIAIATFWIAMLATASHTDAENGGALPSPVTKGQILLVAYIIGAMASGYVSWLLASDIAKSDGTKLDWFIILFIPMVWPIVMPILFGVGIIHSIRDPGAPGRLGSLWQLLTLSFPTNREGV